MRIYKFTVPICITVHENEDPSVALGEELLVMEHGSLSQLSVIYNEISEPLDVTPERSGQMELLV